MDAAVRMMRPTATLPGSLSAILVSLLLVYQRMSNSEEGIYLDTKAYEREYDFIIVGGGTAGATLASRLSEVPTWKILLLEAGDEQHELSEMPLGAYALAGTKIDWRYKTERQTSACLGLLHKKCHWSSGKVLGGSSVINYMLYVRGNRKDYDSWAGLGNPGWSYDDVLPYFKKAENNLNDEYARNGYHGRGGPLTVSNYQYHTPLASMFAQAAQQMNWPVRDCNAADQYGFMTPQATVRKGERVSTNKAYLRPLRTSRPNLFVSKNSYVNRVMLNKKVETVYGVEFKKGFTTYNIRAKREVILTAGAIRTPHLLLLSGIGPSRQISENNVFVGHNLPGVGRNLQDHISPGGIVFLIDKPVSLLASRVLSEEAVMNWVSRRQGPLTLPGGVEGLAWVNTKYSNDSTWPDLQFHFGSGSVLSDFGELRKAHAVPNSTWNAVYAPHVGKDSWMVLPMILRPKSTGNVKLRGFNPNVPPRLYPNYMTKGDDIKVLVEGIKMAIEYSKTPAMRALNSTLLATPLPQCSNWTFGSDEYWECHVRHYTVTEHHFCCTAKMGPASDRLAVVDERLKVRGLKGLRVADASVMPNVPSGNTNAIVNMIAEKAADMIKEDYFSGDPTGGK